MQTVLLGSSNAAIVEFLIPEAGQYIMVDHHFANASQGAIGLVDASDKKQSAADLEHHNMPATATPNEPMAMKGKLDFESKCLACHSIGQGRKLGPDLAGVTKRRSDEWLAKWMQSPEKMLAEDADAKAMLKEYNNIPMPNQNLNAPEIQQYLKYFHWYDAQPAAAAQPAGGHG
jgi:nitrite reductase (NO-forming)